MDAGARTRRTPRRRPVAVVVPALDEAEHLPLLLADLAAQTRPAADVIVVDGGSSDDTVSVAAAAGVRTLLAGPVGVARQRNLGAVAVGGELLLFVDADVRLPPRFLERVAGRMERGDLDVACPLFRPITDQRSVRLFFALMNAIFWTTAPVLASGGGMVLAVRRDLFVHLGGFDPRFRFEDAHLLRRAGAVARYRVVLTPAFVSDRRFRRDGTARTIGAYAAIGVLVALGLFRAANRIDYRFGAYAADRSAST